jgi:hypothetical protein
LEQALTHIGVGIVAAAFGVFAGVQVHTSQIADIKERLRRIEDKVDRLVERDTK